MSTGPSSDDKKMLQRAYNVQGEKDTRHLYRDWSKSYDQTMVSGLCYNSPEKVAQLLASHLDDKDVLIADIGCGTGLAGASLAALRYSNIHGLDYSEEMLQQAKKLGIFARLINVDLTMPLAIETGIYDAALSSGMFTYGHLNADCLDEIFRIIKPGGLFACVVRVQIWQNMGFEDKFEALETAGVISRLSDQLDSNYDESTDKDGRYLLFQRN